MTEENDEDAEQLTDSRSIPFRLSELATFAPDSVAVMRRPIEGLLSMPPGWHPLDRPLGEECGDTRCPYRCFEFALHPDSASLLENYLISAELNGIPFEALAEGGLRRDIYRVSSIGEVLVADIGAHPINYRVPVTPWQLRHQPASSLCWEIVRILRDVHCNQALRLPPGDTLGEDFAIHSDAAEQLQITRLGTLDEEFPIVAPGVLDHGAMSKLLMRLVKGVHPTQTGRRPKTPGI
jgi:hypothetical protein